MKKTTQVLVGVACVLLAQQAWAAGEKGKIKVCRNPPIVSLSDGKEIKFPPLRYVGAADNNGTTERTLEIHADGGSIGKGKTACAVLNAELVSGDGKPVKAGLRLVPAYAGGEDADFKGYNHLAEIFVGSSKVIVVSDFK
jgi:hypothetical protein